MFKLLSIDFDYFQNVDKYTLMDYPDGIDLPVNISNMVWDSKYRYCGNIKNVTINQNLLDQVKSMLKNQDASIPVFIAESHEMLYHMVRLYASPDERLHITHIDMHHDYSRNKELDCGNWVNFVDKKYKKFSMEWFTRAVAIEVYGLEHDFPYRDETQLSTIKDEVYDGIFICKSSAWIPPHLDTHFARLCGLVMGHFMGSASIVPGLVMERKIPFLEEQEGKGHADNNPA